MAAREALGRLMRWKTTGRLDAAGSRWISIESLGEPADVSAVPAESQRAGPGLSLIPRGVANQTHAGCILAP